MDAPTHETIQQMHRWFAVECNNSAWDFVSKAERSPEDNRQMLYQAYAAAYHWSMVGQPIHNARAEMTLAHVHSLLGHSALAIHYAQSCLDFVQNNPVEDWDKAFALAEMSFAAAISGDADLHQKYYAEALVHGKAIQNSEDRQVFFEEFNRLPRPGFHSQS